MKKLKVVVAIPGENSYLQEQEAAVKEAARRLGVELQVINAYNDAVTQSQQLLEVLQSEPASRPDGIIIEPVTAMGMPRVAEAAVAAGVAWVISNAEVDYLERLRRIAKSAVFAVSQDHLAIGRLQAQQFTALLPNGGSVLYLRGPMSNSLATRRTQGIETGKSDRIKLKTLKIEWTERNAYQSINSWLRLSTVHATDIDLISSQNTDFISAARRAFQDHTGGPEQEKWLSRLYTAAGLSSQTKSLVDRSILTAAVVTSLTMDTALDMLTRALKTGAQPAEHIFVPASSYPSLEELARRKR